MLSYVEAFLSNNVELTGELQRVRVQLLVIIIYIISL